MEDPRTFEHELLSFTRDNVALIVGREQEQEHFHVHRPTLEQNSEYFRFALNGEWKESEKKEIVIENADVHVVHRYLHFVFTGRIASKATTFQEAGQEYTEKLTTTDWPKFFATVLPEVLGGDDEASTELIFAPSAPVMTQHGPGQVHMIEHPVERMQMPEEEEIYEPTPGDMAATEYQVLADLYCLGEFVQDNRFQDAVMDAILARVEENASKEEGAYYHYYPTTPGINTIYAGTPPDSPARRMMVHIYSTQGMSEWLTENIHAEFLLELTRRFCELNRVHQSYVRMFGRADLCEYHQHGMGRRCRVEAPRKRKRSGSQSSEDSN